MRVHDLREHLHPRTPADLRAADDEVRLRLRFPERHLPAGLLSTHLCEKFIGGNSCRKPDAIEHRKDQREIGRMPRAPVDRDAGLAFDAGKGCGAHPGDDRHIVAAAGKQPLEVTGGKKRRDIAGDRHVYLIAVAEPLSRRLHDSDRRRSGRQENAHTLHLLFRGGQII